MIVQLDSSCRFPDPRDAEPSGLLAFGGDLSPERLLRAYASGIFPWYGEDDPVLWWSPPERAVFLHGEGRLPRRVTRQIRNTAFEVRVDTCFGSVITRCAGIPRADQAGTWIGPDMQAAYQRLHEAGFAHSFETFLDGRLVGGLYGVSLGAAFFGESMFSEVEQASRVAFQALCETLWGWGFQLIDGQLPNDNLARLGARILPRVEFLHRLGQAMRTETRRGKWSQGA